MKILCLTNYFPPEIGGAVHLVYELADTLVGRGHDVTVVTGFPRYNLQVEPAPYRGRAWMRERMGGIQVLRLRTPSFPRDNLLLRGVEHFLVPSILLLRALQAGRQDVVFTVSPPLPLGLAAYGLSRIWRVPFVVNIQDLFPQEVILLGLLKNQTLIRVFEAIERFVYRKADCVTVHSPGNRDYALSHGGFPEHVRVVYNWVDTDRIRPAPRENVFRREHRLCDRFVVSYAGTMGYAQDMSIIIEAAQRLRQEQGIVFLLVGDGPDKPRAAERATAMQLGNVTFLPTQPWSAYPEVLAASDVSMINLSSKLTTPVVPSKLMSIMAAGRPVVASIPLHSDASRIVAEADCGLCVEAGDADGLAHAILTLYRDSDRAEAMGQRGRLYAESHFSKRSCAGSYEEIFNEVRRGWRKGP
jgi:colanic acid biosynthesis glycosyl transferase WcaI